MEPDRRYQRTPTRQRELQLAGGLQGIAETLRYMNQAVNQYKTNPQVRELALSLTRNLPQKDYAGEVRALFNYVQKRIRYVRDINGVETLQTPTKTLEYGQGDCDDKSILLATLLESLGHKTRFRAVGMRPGSLSHVSVETQLGGKWLNLETTEPVAMGWAPPYIAEQMTSDNLDGLFSGVNKALRKVAHAFEDFDRKTNIVHRAGDKVMASPTGRKIVGTVGGVLTFIPPVSYIGVAMTLAAKAGDVHATEVAARKMRQTVAAQNQADTAEAKRLADTRYVYDNSTKLIREATSTDAGLQQFVLNPARNVLEPAPATQISSLVPGSAVNLPSATVFPLPYAAAGYPPPQNQVVFQSPSGGLTTTPPAIKSNSQILSSIPWVAVAAIGGVSLLLILRSKNHAPTHNRHK